MIGPSFRRVMESKIRFEDLNPLDLSDFSLNTVSKYISILNGVGKNKISILELNELLHLLDYDGKLEISKFDLKIFKSIRNSLLAKELDFSQIEKLRKLIQVKNDLVLDLLDDLELKQRLGFYFIPDVLFRLRPVFMISLYPVLKLSSTSWFLSPIATCEKMKT